MSDVWVTLKVYQMTYGATDDQLLITSPIASIVERTQSSTKSHHGRNTSSAFGLWKTWCWIPPLWIIMNCTVNNLEGSLSLHLVLDLFMVTSSWPSSATHVHWCSLHIFWDFRKKIARNWVPFPSEYLELWLH